MTVEGVFKGGVVVFPGPVELREGMKVYVTPAEPESGDSSLAETLLKFSGLATGLPNDFAEQHDHYLHGTPKR